ncbi:MAG TPA: TonB-dependent receptor [Longimicrobiales bacterium]
MRGALVILATLALAGQAAAQSVGWLRGRVVDAATGAAVVGAQIRVEPGEGGAERDVDGGAGRPRGRAGSPGAGAWGGVSGADGAWRVGPLRPGVYVVYVEHVGYAPAERRVDLPAGGTPLELRLTPRPVPLDALVVTAGRRRQRLAETVVATELVSSREIRETGATDLAAVLTERTGVALQGGHPAGAGVMIQGMGSERVLILVDGQPFIGRISGMVDVSRIPTSMIERVEVVKGPQSTLYGSEAMGGVVNVITRSPERAAWGASATLTAGDQGRLDAAASALGGVGALTGLVEVGRRTIDLAPGQPGAGGALARRWDGLAKVGWRTPVEGLRVEAGALLLDERQRWRTGQLYHFADNLQWSGRVGAVWERGNHRLSPTFFATAFDHLSRQGTGAEPVAGTGEEETQRLVEGELLYALTWGGHALDAGIEARREAIRSERVAGGERTRTTLESFIQAPLSWRGLRLVPGLRMSWTDSWGTHWTPRLAAMLRPTPRVALRVSVGAGFRAPAFKEQFMEFLNIGPGFGYTVRGNPELRPEISRNVTASVEWVGARTYLRVQAFDNRFADFIETRAVGDSSGLTVFTYGNVDDGFTRGAEIEAGLTWGGWRLEGGYGLLRAEHADTGEPLLGRPRSSARAVLGYARPDGLRVTLTGIYTGETAMRRTESATEWRDGFLRFDAGVARAIPGGFELVAGVDNLFDEYAAEWPGFTGRHIYVGLSWRASGEPGDER